MLVPADAVLHGPSQGGRRGAPFVFVGRRRPRKAHRRRDRRGRRRQGGDRLGCRRTATSVIVDPPAGLKDGAGRAGVAMTPLPLSIAFAHLWARKRQTAVSIVGVMLGVAIFIAIGGMMNGFHSYFLSQLVDTNPHIVITDEIRQAAPQPLTLLHPDGAVEVRRVLPRDPVRGIAGASAILDALNADGRRRGGAFADRPGHLAPRRARLRGDRHRRRRPARNAGHRYRPRHGRGQLRRPRVRTPTASSSAASSPTRWASGSATASSP